MIKVHVHRSRDDAPWKEEEHPRAQNGQFAKYNTGSAMHAELEKQGYKKQKQKPGETLKYVHPEGHRVTIHPPTNGKKQSSVFTSHKEGHAPVKGEGSAQFAHLFRNKPKAEKKEEIVTQTGTVSAAKELGFNHLFTSETTGNIEFSTPNAGLIVIKQDGSWSMLPTPEGKEINGKGAEALKKAYNDLPDTKTKASPGGSPGTAEAKELNSHLTEAGWKPEATLNGMAYKKGNATIEVKPNGEWESKSPGHYSKTGTGAQSLKDLLAGKTYPVGQEPWKNGAFVSGATGAAEPEESHKIYKSIEKHAPEATPKEKNAISFYGGIGYQKINDCLRYQHECDDHRVAPIREWLEKASLPEDTTVYRGVKGEYAKVLKSIITEGTVFRDKGFLSTSPNPNVAKGFSSGLTMEISVKKGAKGAAISHMSGHPGEHEILFQHGSKLHVLAFDPKKGHVKCELVQE